MGAPLRTPRARPAARRASTLRTTSRHRERSAIAGEGAEVVRVDGSYDDAVRIATEDARLNDWVVVSDTSWDGYERIPRLIMLGYTRMMDEVVRRAARASRCRLRARRSRRSAVRGRKLVRVSLDRSPAGHRLGRAARRRVPAGVGSRRPPRRGRWETDDNDGRTEKPRGLAARLCGASADRRQLSRHRRFVGTRGDSPNGATRKATIPESRPVHRAPPLSAACSPCSAIRRSPPFATSLQLSDHTRALVIVSEGVTDPDVWAHGDGTRVMSASWSQVPAVILLFFALTVLMTWPQAAHMATHVGNSDDPLLSIWRMAWIAHALPRFPAELFNGNIFYPEPRTLAYSDAVVLQGLAGAPLIWSGVSVVTAYNWVLLGSIALSGAAMWLYAFQLTGSRRAALRRRHRLRFRAVSIRPPPSPGAPGDDVHSAHVVVAGASLRLGPRDGRVSAPSGRWSVRCCAGSTTPSSSRPPFCSSSRSGWCSSRASAGARCCKHGVGALVVGAIVVVPYLLVYSANRRRSAIAACMTSGSIRQSSTTTSRHRSTTSCTACGAGPLEKTSAVCFRDSWP